MTSDMLIVCVDGVGLEGLGCIQECGFNHHPALV